MSQCPNCKRVGAPDARYCDRCGTPLPDSSLISGAHGTSTAFKFGSFLNAISNLSFNYLKAILAAVAIVLVIVIIALSFTSSGSLNSFSYLKDNELYYMSLSQSKGRQVSSNLIDGVSTIANLEEYVRISNDGKKIFFVDKYDGNGYDLYYKKTSKLKRDSQKLASDVNIYDINDKGSLVTYIKGGGDLYQHNLNEQSDRIDENVMSFVVSDDGKRIVYLKVDSESSTYAVDVYLSKSGNVGENVLTGVENICKISDDLKEIYYIKHNILYKAVLGKSTEKLAADVSEVINIYDSGECYFIKKNEDGVLSLYYFNGKTESVLVSDHYYSYEDFASNSPAIIYCTDVSDGETKEYAFRVAIHNTSFDLDNGFSFDLNDEGSELRYLISNSNSTSSYTLYTCKITQRGLSDKAELDTDIYSGHYVSDDKYLYIKNYIPETTSGDIYIDDKLVDKNAYCGYINYSVESQTLIYFTDIDETNNATLKIFKGRKSIKILDDVYMHSLVVAPEGELIFLADYKNGAGTLYICKNKRAKKIDIDISSIIRFSTNEEYDGKIMSNM